MRPRTHPNKETVSIHIHIGFLVDRNIGINSPSLLHCALSLLTDFSWLRLTEDLGLFLFLSELALSCMEAGEREGGKEGREGEEEGVRGGRGREYTDLISNGHMRRRKE